MALLSRQQELTVEASAARAMLLCGAAEGELMLAEGVRDAGDGGGGMGTAAAAPAAPDTAGVMGFRRS